MTMYSTLTDFDQNCLDNAAYFTAVRGRDPRNRIRQQFDSLDAAKGFAAQWGDGSTIIYAVTAQGRSAPILTA
jgi:hypothetical protein